MHPKKQPRKLTEAEFRRVFKEVRDDINELQLHDGILTGVMENLERYPKLSDNFPGFFAALLSAMRTDLIIRLGRIYDPEGTGHASCTLVRCLRLMSESREFFTDAAIQARLSEGYRKTYPDYLALHRPDEKQLAEHIDQIEGSRERLINLRHKVYAHKDIATVLSGNRSDFLHTHDEVKQLIQQAHDIWNFYSRIWNASTWSDQSTMNADDYQRLFEYLRRGMGIQ
ncbi:MAG TPA: hypothetical protein VMU04_03435 [Candidatus Acidoferrum sp.]|nr:hypothetical protein [Candidatus Acidoferrum sp.]